MSINEGLWSARMPNGDVRAGTLDQLSEAFRAGHLGEGTMVRAAGSENWIRLADVLGGAAAFAAPAAAAVLRPSAPPTTVAPPPTTVAPPSAQPPSAPPPASVVPPSLQGMNGSNEVWQVRLASGDVRSGTRQQLEEAFRAGHLDQRALVLPPGMHEWVPVGNLVRPPAPVAPMALQDAAIAPPRPPMPPQSSAPPPAVRVDGTAELWQVRLPDGQVRSGTRRQLEEAFSAGHLDDAAMVLPAGASLWVRLDALMDRPPPAPPEAPAAAPEPAPVAAAQPEPAALAEPQPEAAAPPSAAATESAPEPQLSPERETVPSPEGWESQDELWQVKLSLKQLQEAFHARLLDDDTQVLPAGADEWVPLLEIRRALPPPFGSALAQPMTHDGTTAGAGVTGFQASAAHTEPASRTEPWPATGPTNGLPPASD